MKKILYVFIVIIVNCWLIKSPLEASPSASPIATGLPEASTSAEKEASVGGLIVKKVVEKIPDITEPKSEVKGKLERYIEQTQIRGMSPFNIVRYAIRYAVTQGVPANTIVLILLFPLVATIVVFARHIIGLKSFGIFTPALLSVALLATGLLTGIGLFLFILTVATLVRMLLKKIRFQYLPRMALFMLLISLSIFSILLISPAIGSTSLITIGIFPLLILILLVEDFLDLQITRNLPQALIITGETLLLAIGSFYVMNLEALQKFVLVNPELFIVLVLGSILLIEQYSGLRLLEIWRFRKLLK